MSIQGWFHGPEGPTGKEQATVNQLLAQVPEGLHGAGYVDYKEEVCQLDCMPYTYLVRGAQESMKYISCSSKYRRGCVVLCSRHAERRRMRWLYVLCVNDSTGEKGCWGKGGLRI